MNAPTAFFNGHDRFRSEKDNLFHGTLEFLPAPQPLDSPEAGAEAMFNDGCVQFPDLFTPAEVADLRAWIDSLGGDDAQYEMKDWCFNKHLGEERFRDPRWLMLMDRSPVPEVLSLALGPDFICYGGSLWVTGKGRQMPMHADHLLIRMPGDMLFESNARVPIFRASLHIYLDDQVEEIGPTTVIPGSHRAGHRPDGESTWHGITPKMASVKAGGALLFRHDLWHGAGMNSSTRRRYMIQVHYAVGFIHRPCAVMVDPPRYDEGIIARLTVRQRSMLGDRSLAPPPPTY